MSRKLESLWSQVLQTMGPILQTENMAEAVYEYELKLKECLKGVQLYITNINILT
jgi:hypothetical protein